MQYINDFFLKIFFPYSQFSLLAFCTVLSPFSFFQSIFSLYKYRAIYYVLEKESAHTRTITIFYSTKSNCLVQLTSSSLQPFIKIPHLHTDRICSEELLHCHGKSLFCYGLFHLQPVAILISLSGLIISGSFSLPCNGRKEK